MGACSPPDPLDLLLGFLSFLGDPIGTIVRMIANLMLAAAIAIFGELTEEVPTLGDGMAPGADGSAGVPALISDQIEWIIVYLSIGSILVAAARMALERRGDAGKQALQGFLRVILVAGAGAYTISYAAELSDDFSDHLFSSAALEVVKSVPCIDNGSSLESFLLLVLSFLLLISAIVHVLMLYIRLGVLTILLGTLPLAAAASMTNWGTGWWRKHIGWLVAWLLYKPTVGLIMFSGAEMIAVGNENDSAHSRIAGIGVLLLSAVALPALLKIIVPATAALGTGDPSAAGISAVGGAVASGAKKVAGSAFTSQGDSGPSGSRGGDSRSDQGGSGPSGSGGRDGSTGGDGTSGSGGHPGSSGSGGHPGSAGSDGSAGATGGPGSTGGTGAPGASTAGATAGAARLAGPVGVAVDAAAQGARVGRAIVTSSISGADGDAGHN
ncbi:hypothetical protein [Micromonospora sp. NPDC023956]|uniref:hypothetical protein n=1 Tax=Micromonospora sp. NPDC023956 TaxID=3155722 RepID=UPI0033E57D1D